MRTHVLPIDIDCLSSWQALRESKMHPPQPASSPPRRPSRPHGDTAQPSTNREVGCGMWDVLEYKGGGMWDKYVGCGMCVVGCVGI
jgi:hypothetical protein